jgi:predicted amidohydrolase
MKIGYVQFRPLFGKKQKNLKRILGFLNEGADKNADLLVLPELCNTGYVFTSQAEVRALSEEVPEGETTQALVSFAGERNLCVVVGLCEKKENKYFNSSILAGPDGFISVYRKPHLFDKEKLWFTSGDGPISVYDTPKARIGVMICFDWFFPEVLRILALKGAQIVCHPSNLVLPFCQRTLLGVAVQNRVFVITANRVGTEHGVRFTGMSQIVSPDMKTLAVSSKNREEVRIVEVDPKEADSKKISERNDLWADRRVDLYRPLLDGWERKVK